MTMKLDKDYWEFKWENDQTGWDIGFISPPIKDYIEQIKDKNTKILIPGAGNSYEGEYIFKKGFSKIHLLDYSNLPFKQLQSRCPEFPSENLINQNFFDHNANYDLILEQTFFSAIHPSNRESYVQKMHDLLNDGGKLVGLLFKVDFGNPHPPYGGNIEEYTELFTPWFEIEVMEESYNSIPPRQGSELFFNLKKKSI